jgi:hypothetical protein
MTVGRIDSIKPIAVEEIDRNVRVDGKTGEGDSVSISKEAREAFANEEFRKAMEIVAAAPAEMEIRPDRVADAKAKMADPNYMNEKVMASAAEDIMAFLGIG